MTQLVSALTSNCQFWPHASLPNLHLSNWWRNVHCDVSWAPKEVKKNLREWNSREVKVWVMRKQIAAVITWWSAPGASAQLHLGPTQKWLTKLPNIGTQSARVRLERQSEVKTTDWTFVLFTTITSVGDMSQKPPLPPSIGNNDRYRAVLRPTVPEIVIIFSSSCSVSTEWANYITNLLKSQGYKHIVMNDIESSSSKRGAEGPRNCSDLITLTLMFAVFRQCRVEKRCCHE